VPPQVAGSVTPARSLPNRELVGGSNWSFGSNPFTLQLSIPQGNTQAALLNSPSCFNRDRITPANILRVLNVIPRNITNSLTGDFILPSYPVIGQNPFLLGTATTSTPGRTRPVVPGAFYSPVINPSNNENFSTGPTRPSPPPSNVGVSRIFFRGIEKGEKKVVDYPTKFFGKFPHNSWALFFSEWQRNRTFCSLDTSVYLPNLLKSIDEDVLFKVGGRNYYTTFTTIEALDQAMFNHYDSLEKRTERGGNLMTLKQGQVPLATFLKTYVELADVE
jgi:hypothetical protein